jgi:hypothetical protein
LACLRPQGDEAPGVCRVGGVCRGRRLVRPCALVSWLVMWLKRRPATRGACR